MANEANDPIGRLREATLARVASALVAALGLLVIIGWAFDITAFKSVLPGLSTLKFNIALCFLLSAGALALSTTATRPGVAVMLALAVALISALTLVEYAAGVDLPIDQLVFHDPTTSLHTVPGPMSAVTAVEFLLFAASIVLARETSRIAVAGFLAASAAGVLIAFLALAGYLYGLRELYEPIPQNSVAVHTAGGFFVLFLGVAALRPDLGWMRLLQAHTITGAFARWLLPTIVLTPLLLGWLLLKGAEAGLFEPREGIALFALASVVALAAVVWIGGVAANRLGAQLERRERAFQTMIDTALDAFILMDQHGRILEWNPEAERMFGWPREEAVGRLVKDTIIPPEMASAHAAGLERFLATGEGAVLRRRVEVTAMRRDGVYFPAELMILPTKHEREWTFSGFVRDLSALKEAEALARQSQKMEAVGQLTSGMAHDFNNLLTVVIATLDAMLTRAPEEVRARLANALSAAERGADLIRQLLAFSRKQTLAPQALDLNAVTSGMMPLLTRTLGEQIEIELKLDPKAWTAFADKGQVESALLNLAINSRDAMPTGGKLTIETGNAELDDVYVERNAEVTPGAYVVLAVSDTGEGMAPDVVERACEPFFTTKEPGKGSGLGLSMIYGFAKQSKGHLKIYSEQGHGTTVRLYLPRFNAGAAAPAPENNAAANQRGGGETILVLEDDPHVRAVAVSQLRDLGYTVLEAASAGDARAFLAGERHIDLLFTDVVLPGQITGRHVSEEAVLKRPTLKTLFTSGYTDNSIVHHGRLDPGVHFLPKPYRARDLAKKIREMLDGA